MAQRGLVIAKPIAVSTTGFSFPATFDPLELRSWLLHWDRLDYPIGGFNVPESPDETFLIGEGIMQRTPGIQVLGGRPDKAHPNDRGYFLSTIETFRHHDKHDPGSWALAYSKFNTRHPRQPSFAFRSDVREDSGLFDKDDDDAGRGLLVRLVNALPVPQYDIALEDIVLFRTRRQAELQALRYHLDQLYDAIANSSDKPLREQTEVDALQRVTLDLVKSAEGLPITFRFVDLTSRINLANSVMSFIAAQQLGLDLLTSNLAAAALLVGPSIGLRGDTAKGSPFEYVVRAHQEL